MLQSLWPDVSSGYESNNKIYSFLVFQFLWFSNRVHAIIYRYISISLCSLSNTTNCFLRFLIKFCWPKKKNKNKDRSLFPIRLVIFISTDVKWIFFLLFFFFLFWFHHTFCWCFRKTTLPKRGWAAKNCVIFEIA